MDENLPIIDVDEYKPIVETFLPSLFSTGEPKPIPEKTLHERYWTSWEEEKLIELWRKHKEEISAMDDHSPVFRLILEDMKQSGFQVTSRECRRKITTFRNKYFAEKKKLESAVSPDAQSKWPLYPLIDVVIRETNQDVNINHEVEIVDELLNELKLAAPEYLQKSDTDPGNTTPEIFKNVDEDVIILPTTTCLTRYRSIIPIRRVTPKMITQIKKDVKNLEKQRDNDLKKLRQQQNDYYTWVGIFRKTQLQLKQMLQSMEENAITN